MITIFLGDDTAESRRKYSELKKKYTLENTAIAELDKDDLPQLDSWLLESQSLFSQRRVFFAQNILSKKGERELVKAFDTLSKNNELFVWEESLEDRVAKFFFQHATINNSKLPTTIFTFLDTIYPSNFKLVELSFQALYEKIDPHMILFMLQKRMRELILVAGGKSPSKKIADWQVERLKNQVKKWESIEKLLVFYDSLYRIEMYEKTGKNYYSIIQALDILFVYYL